MAFITVRELKRLVHPHYLISILLALSFLILKKTPNVCTKLFREGCELTSVSLVDNVHPVYLLFFSIFDLKFDRTAKFSQNFHRIFVESQQMDSHFYIPEYLDLIACLSSTQRQNEILFFCAVIIVFRTRKHGAVHLLPYLKTACLLAKLTNFILYFMTEPVLGIIYSIICVCKCNFSSLSLLLYFKSETN